MVIHFCVSLFQENASLISLWIFGTITFIAFEAVCIVYSNVLREHVNRVSTQLIRFFQFVIVYYIASFKSQYLHTKKVCKRVKQVSKFPSHVNSLLNHSYVRYSVHHMIRRDNLLVYRQLANHTTQFNL